MEDQHTQALVFPHIGLHPHTPKGISSQISQPNFDHLRIPILDLYQPPQRDPLKVLLAPLVDKVGFKDRPALSEFGEGDRPLGREAEIVGSAHGKVGHKLDVADRVGTKLEVTDGLAV
jgi:hypothetical protein